jgi:NTP pyrophosphatase (non-canonical NTP hydrolase)
VNYRELEEKVSQWADDKGILDKGTPIAQSEKTLEEAQEIKDALLSNDRDELVDALGDTLVTLIIQAEMNNLDLLDCLETAYDVISKRSGKMVDGTFIKDNK